MMATILSSIAALLVGAQSVSSRIRCIPRCSGVDCVDFPLQGVSVSLQLGLGPLFGARYRRIYFRLHVGGRRHQETALALVEHFTEFLQIGPPHASGHVSHDGASAGTDGTTADQPGTQTDSQHWK